MEDDDGQIFIYNQEESVKPKNIVEKIDFDSETYSFFIFHYFLLIPHSIPFFFSLYCFTNGFLFIRDVSVLFHVKFTT